MQVVNAAIDLSSSHREVSERTQVERLQVRVGNQTVERTLENGRPNPGRGNPPGRSEGGASVLDMVAISIDRLEISEEAIKKTAVLTDGEDGSVGIFSSDEKTRKTELMRVLLEKMLGRKVNLPPYDESDGKKVAKGPKTDAQGPELSESLQELKDKVEALEARVAELELARGQSPGPGVSVAYDRTTRIYEKEDTSFRASGVIQTADGKSIEFNAALDMSREFAAEESVSLRIGKPIDPLVINYSGNSAELTDTRFSFDLDANGEVELVPFATGNSGFLALDRNSDGIINDGSELFGPTTGDGFEELSVYDEDGNRFIDSGDSVYNQLKVVSVNSDGTQNLRNLSDSGVSAIYLDNIETPFSIKDEANETLGVVRSTSVTVDEEGGVGTVQQVDLAV